jgi:MarR family transcriptional regulator, organic hydroperoxide resistance regulator
MPDKASKRPKESASEAAAPKLATADAASRVLLEIRKLIAASILFNVLAAEKVGLGLTDMQLIHMLQLYGPSTPSRLAHWTGLSSGGVTVALDRLEKAGYLRRAPNPADRRSLLATLIPSRLRKLTAMFEGVEAHTLERLGTLPQGDLEAVLRFFEALQAGQA